MYLYNSITLEGHNVVFQGQEMSLIDVIPRISVGDVIENVPADVFLHITILNEVRKVCKNPNMNMTVYGEPLKMLFFGTKS